MGSSLPTRRDRERAIVVHALTKPRNLLIAAGLLVVGLVVGPLIVFAPLAIVAYVLLVGFTLFDDREAKRALDKRRGPG